MKCESEDSRYFLIQHILWMHFRPCHPLLNREVFLCLIHCIYRYPLSAF